VAWRLRKTEPSQPSSPSPPRSMSQPLTLVPDFPSLPLLFVPPYFTTPVVFRKSLIRFGNVTTHPTALPSYTQSTAMPNTSTTATSSTRSFHTAPEIAADNNLASLHHTASTLFVARTAGIFNTTNELLGDIKALLQTLVEEKDKDRQMLKELIEQHARMGEGTKRIAERQKVQESEGLITGELIRSFFTWRRC
jgi:hypothetical protein